MPARGGDFQSALGRTLAAHMAEIHVVFARGKQLRVGDRYDGDNGLFTCKVGHSLAQM